MFEDVTKWLEGLGLGKYAATFVENDVDFRALPALSEQDLKELGVSLGHRRILQQAIATLSETVETLPEEQPSSEVDTDTGLATWERHPGERKPVTMLFADITGSTALTEKLDAEETHELLYGATQRMCEAVERNRGTVCRFMGDGLMAMFGAPVASEHHAIDACEAALEMQHAIRDYASDMEGLQIRVGLHSGEVVVLTVGEGNKAEYDASGPTVPIAARMEQVAEPGEVYLTAATRALSEERIVSEALEPVAVKGISEPVSVFALRRVRSIEEVTTVASRTPFVGRRAELKQVRGMLDTCFEEGQGQTIYVRGEPGIGKTRLVGEFQLIAESKGFVCHRGLVLPFGVGKGQDAIRSLVRSLLRISSGDGKDERGKAAEGAINKHALEPDERVYLNDLLDLPQATELRALYDAMDNTTRNQGKRAVVSKLVTSIGREQPLLVIVEDIHWADPIVLAHLAVLTKTVAEGPTLAVMTSRIEGDPLDKSWRSTTEGAPFVTIDLGPLRKQESIELIGEFIDSDDPLAEGCLQRAAGNPLFLEQLLRNAREGTTDSLPDSIQSLVLARLDRLEAEDKRALQAAAVIGQRFDMDTLCHLLETNDYDGRGLVEHSLVRPEGMGYLFAHALIQEGVYASLLKNQRRGLHRRAAEWFAQTDAVLYAQHLDRGVDEGAPRAYLVAAKSQSAQYRTQEAIRLVERGLEIARTPVEQCELNCLRGEQLWHLGEVADSMEAYRDALNIAEDDTQRCEAWIGLATAMRGLDQYDEALETLDMAQVVASRQDLKRALAQIHSLRGNLYFPLGKIDGCIEQHKLALQHAQEANAPELEASALGGVGDGLYVQGRMRSAHEYFSQCLELCRQHGFGRIEVANRQMIGFGGTLFYLNEMRAALEESSSTVTAARRIGQHRAEQFAHMGVAYGCMWLGDFDRARQHAEMGFALAERIGARRFLARHLHYLARVLIAEGRSRDAVQKLEEAIAISRETGIRYVGAAILGTLSLATDDPEKRELALREGEELLRTGCVGHNYFEFYQDGIETCLKIGDWASVDRYASALEDYTRPEPLPFIDFIIERGRALAAFGRGKRDCATIQEIQRLRDDAVRDGLKVAVSALDEALSAA